MTSRNISLLKFLFFFILLSVAGFPDAHAITVKEWAFGMLKKQGESYFHKGSFAKAHEVYRKAQQLNLAI